MQNTKIINYSMYADDRQIYQTGKGISTVHTKLEESASSATDWYENNLLEGNLKKYQTMFIQNKYGHMKEQFSCTEHSTNLNLNGKIIRTSDSLKILGVTLDNKFKFNYFKRLSPFLKIQDLAGKIRKNSRSCQQDLENSRSCRQDVENSRSCLHDSETSRFCLHDSETSRSCQQDVENSRSCLQDLEFPRFCNSSNDNSLL